MYMFDELFNHLSRPKKRGLHGSGIMQNHWKMKFVYAPRGIIRQM